MISIMSYRAATEELIVAVEEYLEHGGNLRRNQLDKTVLEIKRLETEPRHWTDPYEMRKRLSDIRRA